MDRQDFLFELGCEEIPARFLTTLTESLARSLEQELNSANLKYEPPKIFSTPRRIAVFIPNVTANQAAGVIERTGPSAEKAFDKDGTPTLACIGFARSCGVSADQLKIRKTDKGDRVYCKVEKPGEATINLLPKMVHNALKQLPLAKPMHWGDYSTQFIRPVHWATMLFGKEQVEATVFGLNTINHTYGHRFHHPQPIALNHANEYNNALTEQGFVIADSNERKRQIRKQIQQAAGEGLHAIIDEELLNEVTGLVEWPVALRGQFNPEFLRVPKEVLITSMKTHQKCFPVENEQGVLQNYFILVSNIQSKDPQTVIKGNERVIHARLSDAAFFFTNDLKHSLESRLQKLQHVVFQKSLGTVADKAQRISLLAHHIGMQTNADAAIAERAGLLSKCDLVSEMVGEFPSLQGTMGHYYAVNDKESTGCAKAIRDHYQPRFSGDELPETLAGCAVALADRLDTLVGILGINQIPTGDKDPFALRRADTRYFSHHHRKSTGC